MDQQVHTAKRSASHGALGRSYAAQASHSHSRSHSHFHSHQRRFSPSQPFARPPPSAKEIRALLVSPGPLASMLKTTTETGDIGIFSIRPTHASGSLPFRSRSALNDGPVPRPVHARASDSSACYGDDRRRMPSYRDATSEIISMYGSESQRSASSSFSPPFDEAAQRSYSMTSYGSRPPPVSKPAGPFPGPPGASFSQRPRSPFPYPTRLRRPGVRPASPALTENGSVDYSRMVEIDRGLHRTAHRPYRPTYAPYSRRPPPGPARVDSRSYPPGGYGPIMGPLPRGPPPGHPATCGPRYRGRRLESGTSETSLRSASLTSIVDMYQPSTCGPAEQRRPMPPPPPGTFYYDYSEDFDNIPPRTAPESVPVAPVPTRDPSMHRARVLDDGCEDRFQDPVDSDDPTLTTLTALIEVTSPDVTWDVQAGPKTKENTKPLPLKPELLLEDFSPQKAANQLSRSGPESSLPAFGCQPVHGGSVEGTPKKQMNASCGETSRCSLKQDGAQSDHVEGFSGTSDLQPGRRALPRSSSQPIQSNWTHPTTSAQRDGLPSTFSTFGGRADQSKVSSIDAGLTDLASFVRREDDVAAVPLDKCSLSLCRRRDTKREPSPTGPLKGQTHDNSYHLGLDGNSDSSSMEPNVGRRLKLGEGRTRTRGHRRNFATLTINPNHLQTASESELPPSIDRSRTPMLAPEPISPARRLRVQNSIPQLMKALPPLPGDLVRSDSCVPDMPLRDFEFPVSFSPFDLTQLSAPKTAATGSPQKSMSEPAPATKGDSGSGVVAASGAMDPTSAGQEGREWEVGEIGPEGIDESAADQQMQDAGEVNLKLKLSRSAMLKTPPPNVGTVRKRSVRDAAFEGSMVPSTCRGKSPFTPRKGTTVRDEQNDAFVCSPNSSTAGSSRQMGDSGDMHTSVSQTKISAKTTSPSHFPSSMSDDGSPKPARGLRKRLSDLRVRSRMRLAEPNTPRRGAGEIFDGPATSESARTTTSDKRANDTPDEIVATIRSPVEERNVIKAADAVPGKGLRGRMSRWMKSAKQAIIVACTGGKKRGQALHDGIVGS